MTLPQYTVELQEDRKHLQQVSNPRLVETPFRSPQLTLWTINADEWLLYWKTPDRAPAHRKRRVEGLVQPFLFDFLLEEKAVGNEGNGARRSRTHLHLVGKRAQSQEHYSRTF